MAPLGATAAVAYGWLAAVSREPSAVAAAAAMVAVMVWTGAAMGEDISSLRATGPAADAAVCATAGRFCARHHVRAVVSVGVYVWVLWAFVARWA
ncbi:hypothetical protein BU14_0217s0014 [Porphyra umbilicalis]|uniref:Uncharacterized protein n=1 Tax=Porphyra umbilicalis TaxID=2786 RepID=A0A1X6P575_PORUM|nr:hypothetical protein BU14_0217s0014 [Porphyra umbilicalis]|eukprot:OSX75900.1 hypothetical protein BU14_0217s0014 [Porphyra umbilicalis]